VELGDHSLGVLRSLELDDPVSHRAAVWKARNFSTNNIAIL
jgi:hypothetical protein